MPSPAAAFFLMTSSELGSLRRRHVLDGFETTGHVEEAAHIREGDAPEFLQHPLGVERQGRERSGLAGADRR